MLALVAGACGEASAPEDDRPLVIATTTIWGDVAAAVAGDKATIEVLMPIGANPHSYEISARQAARLRDADLIVANGLGLESGLLDAIDAAGDDGVTVLYLAGLLDPRPFTGPDDHDDDHEGEHDEPAGDHDDDGLDPHVWMDPIRVGAAAGHIAASLDSVAPGPWEANADDYLASLTALDAEIRDGIATIPDADRKLITNHYAYGYYADRYGLEMLGTVIPAATTEAETSAAAFAELVDLIVAEDVPAIFGSTSEPTDLAEAIAEEAGREVAVITLYTGSLGDPGSGAETYVSMMRTSTLRIVEALG
jgi:zinc/manganese transport system substrate-binding protein